MSPLHSKLLSNHAFLGSWAVDLRDDVIFRALDSTYTARNPFYLKFSVNNMITFIIYYYYYCITSLFSTSYLKKGLWVLLVTSCLLIPKNVPYFHFGWVLNFLTSHKYHFSHPVHIRDPDHTHSLTNVQLS